MKVLIADDLPIHRRLARAALAAALTDLARLRSGGRLLE